MKRRKIYIVVLCSILVLGLVTMGAGYKRNTQKIKVSFEAEINEELTRNRNRNVYRIQKDIPVKRISFSSDYCSDEEIESGMLSIVLGNETVSVEMAGTIEKYGLLGYVGVFDGMAVLRGQLEPITLDILFISEKENFTTMTIGYMDEVVPQIVCLGERSSSIIELSKKQVEVFLSQEAELPKSEEETQEEYEIKAPTTDATIRYQSSDTLYQAGYPTVTISQYHANELENQNKTVIYAKINSQNSSVEYYFTKRNGI